MGIDYVINYPCLPKDALTTEGIVERLKNRDRAEQVVQLYRQQGDHRPISEIGFEVTYRAADGSDHTKLVIAGDLIDQATVLDDFQAECDGCPANRTGQPFGCIGYINYPIANEAEIWLLEQLPSENDPVLFLMLMRGITEFGYTGESARTLRDQVGVYFANPDTLARRYAEMDVTTDVLFEMTFQLGPIQPGHAMMLLLFYRAIPRDAIDPQSIIDLTRHELSPDEFMEQYPFSYEINSSDHPSIIDLKRLLKGLYFAYALNVEVLLDI